MSTLSGSSTLAQVETSFDDNASYLEDNSIAKAAALITAGRILLRRLPSSSAKGSNALTFRLDLIRSEIQTAVEYLLAHDPAKIPGPLVTQPTFAHSRGLS